LFKQAFEQSPHQYVLSRRVERAKTMLKDGERSIAEIATACGFANQGHLTTAFKRRTGVTPASYRKS
jgi:AraC family transcriptional regulator